MNIKSQYKYLFVNRIGNIPTAFMKTTDIKKEIIPDKCYEKGKNDIFITDKPPTNFSSKISIPKHCILKGKWEHSKDTQKDKSNILGNIGSFISENDTLEIPIAHTKLETLAYYKAILINKGDCLKFQTKIPLPLFSMEIGKDYIKEYMLKEEHANGIFIEYHNLPHLHMPIDKHAKGYLILGKKIKNNIYHLSAFSIPYQSAIYTSPNVIHNDSFLIGKYYVIYSKTDSFSTVRLMNSKNKILKTKIVE